MIVEQREGIARARAEIERRRGRGGGAEHVDRERAELGRLDQRSAELDASSAAFDRLANQQAELEAKPDDPLADVWYPLMLGLVLVFGLAGESAALLGALHLHIAGRSVVLVCAVLAAIAIVLMLSLMAQAAWLRFRPGERQKTGPMWLIILLTTLTVSGVVAAVFGFGPATKPTPSPTPTAKPTSTHTLTARPTPRKSS